MVFEGTKLELRAVRDIDPEDEVWWINNLTVWLLNDVDSETKNYICHEVNFIMQVTNTVYLSSIW